jgi:Glycosyltransferase family 87
MPSKAEISPLAFLFLLAVPLAMINTFAFFLALPDALQGHWDFRQLYTAGHMVLSGHSTQVYDYEASSVAQNQVVSRASGALPFNHLAYEALLFSLLALLPYRVAYVALAIVNFGLLAVCFRILRPYLGDLSELPRWLPFVLFLGFLPSTFAISEGQDSILLLILAACSFQLLERGRDRWAGAVLALTLFKFQFALPIALLYLCWKRWRFVEGFVLCGAGIVAVSFAMVGLTGAVTYAKELISMSARLSADGRVRYGIRPELMMNLRGFVYLIGHRILSGSAIQVITAVFSLAVVLWAARRKASFPLAVTVAVLVSYHCFIDDAALLLIPLAVMIGRKSFWMACSVLIIPDVLLFADQLVPLGVIPLLVMLAYLAKPPIDATNVTLKSFALADA